jgi:hypothetical protein
MEAVRRSITIEDLVRDWPSAVRFMIDKVLPWVTCCGPVWGTFEEVARRSGKTESEIDLRIEDLKSHIHTGEGR